MTGPHTIKISLAHEAIRSTVEIDGHDITPMVLGVSVTANVGALTVVSLQLSGRVEIEGAAEVVAELLQRPESAPLSPGRCPHDGTDRIQRISGMGDTPSYDLCLECNTPLPTKEA